MKSIIPSTAKGRARMTTPGHAGGRQAFRALTLSCVLLLTAGTAQAIYVDLSSDSHSGAAEHAFHTRRIHDKIDLGLEGGDGIALSRTLKVVDFEESVVLHSIDMEGFGKVAKVYTDDGIHLITRPGDLTSMRVNRIELTVWKFGHSPAPTIGIDIDLPGSPAQAIPEPGAALLFGAGLVTAGLARRRPRDRH